MKEDIYPCTIVCDRYTGMYSGALWTAWNLDFDEVPKAIDDSDPECWEFWDNKAKDYFIGKGSTPQEAYDDLYNRMYQPMTPNQWQPPKLYSIPKEIGEAMMKEPPYIVPYTTEHHRWLDRNSYQRTFTWHENTETITFTLKQDK